MHLVYMQGLVDTLEHRLSVSVNKIQWYILCFNFEVWISCVVCQPLGLKIIAAPAMWGTKSSLYFVTGLHCRKDILSYCASVVHYFHQITRDSETWQGWKFWRGCRTDGEDLTSQKVFIEWVGHRSKLKAGYLEKKTDKVQKWSFEDNLSRESSLCLLIDAVELDGTLQNILKIKDWVFYD